MAANFERQGWARVGRSLAVAAAVLASVWGMICLLAFVLHGHDPLRFAGATPEIIWRALVRLVIERETLSGVYFTLYFAVKGLAVGLLAAFAVGALLGLAPSKVEFVIPVLNALRAIPLTLLIPFLVAFPVLAAYPPGMHGDLPARDPGYLIGLGTFLYLLVGIVEGIANRSQEREAIFKVIWRFGRFKYLFLVLVPEVIPSFLTALRLAALFSLVLAIVFEQLIQMPGVGRMIQQRMSDSTYTNLLEAEALALLFLVALLGIAIDVAFLGLRKFAGGMAR